MKLSRRELIPCTTGSLLAATSLWLIYGLQDGVSFEDDLLRLFAESWT